MKQTIKPAALASTLLLAASLAGAADKADNTYGSETRTVAPFSNLNIIGPFRVIVTAQPGNTVELSGLRRQFAEIETSVNGDTLTLRQPRKQNAGWTFNLSWGREAKPMTIRVSAAGLKSLRNAGSGDVELQQFNGKQLTLVSDGPGDIQANGKVGDLSVTANGSGDIDLRALSAVNLYLQM